MTIKKYKRWTSQRKMEVVIALIKGVPLEEVSRKSGQPAHVINGWKEAFLQGGQSAFDQGSGADEKRLKEENKTLRAKVGELVMDNDLLYEKIERLEDGIPFHLRRSKR